VNRRYFSINTTGSLASDAGPISAAAAPAATMSALVAPQMSASDRQGLHDNPRSGSVATACREPGLLAQAPFLPNCPEQGSGRGTRLAVGSMLVIGRPSTTNSSYR
jgi:hypothetical protein